MRRRVLLAGMLAAPASGRAQGGFPDRPIRLIIPWPPGGTNDIVGRLVTEGMAARLGQAIVIENRGGAGGMLGADVVAKATPDGYTLVLGGSGSLTITSLVQARVPYDVATAFAPIGMSEMFASHRIDPWSMRTSDTSSARSRSRRAVT